MIKNWWACFLYPVSHLIGNIYSRRVIFVFSFVCGGGIERLVSRFSFFDFSCWCTNDSLKVFIVFIWWCSQRMYDFVFSYCSDCFDGLACFDRFDCFDLSVWIDLAVNVFDCSVLSPVLTVCSGCSAWTAMTAHTVLLFSAVRICLFWQFWLFWFVCLDCFDCFDCSGLSVLTALTV